MGASVIPLSKFQFFLPHVVCAISIVVMETILYIFYKNEDV